MEPGLPENDVDSFYYTCISPPVNRVISILSSILNTSAIPVLSPSDCPLQEFNRASCVQCFFLILSDFFVLRHSLQGNKVQCKTPVFYQTYQTEPSSFATLRWQDWMIMIKSWCCSSCQWFRQQIAWRVNRSVMRQPNPLSLESRGSIVQGSRCLYSIHQSW